MDLLQKTAKPVALVVDIAAERRRNQHQLLTGVQKRVNVLLIECLHVVGDPVADDAVEMVHVKQ